MQVRRRGPIGRVEKNAFAAPSVLRRILAGLGVSAALVAGCLMAASAAQATTGQLRPASNTPRVSASNNADSA
jgi:hypothetical protein